MTLSSSGTKRLLTFLPFSFFDTRRERHNFYYADYFYIVLQSTPTELSAQSPNLN